MVRQWLEFGAGTSKPHHTYREENAFVRTIYYLKCLEYSNCKIFNCNCYKQYKLFNKKTFGKTLRLFISMLAFVSYFKLAPF